ncbi:MAG: hypothetical protein Q4A74_03285 [Cardiobacteriaceae bacterium]|nr:hypothetical protein [Cardiobacteriaceae bacterium]
MTKNVQRCADISLPALQKLLATYGLQVEILPDNADIPGSYWGAPEAGLVKNTLYIRLDTPTHSALHEAGHWICMDEKRRATLDTDAGGTVQEECAVNYLQILLAEALPDIGREQMLKDMTTWGYNYREGSVYAWLEGDAIDAIQWLQQHGLIDSQRQRITQP